MLTLEEFGKVFRDCEVCVDQIVSRHLSKDFGFPGDWAVVLSGNIGGKHWQRAFTGPALDKALLDAALHVCEERAREAFSELGAPNPEDFLHPLLHEHKKEFAELCRKNFLPVAHVDVGGALFMLEQLNLEPRGAMFFVREGQALMGIWSMQVRHICFPEPVFLAIPVRCRVPFRQHIVDASALEDMLQGDGRYSFPVNGASENLPSLFAKVFDAWMQFDGFPLPYSLHSGLLSEYDKALVGRDGAWIMLQDGNASLILPI